MTNKMTFRNNQKIQSKIKSNTSLTYPNRGGGAAKPPRRPLFLYMPDVFDFIFILLLIISERHFTRHFVFDSFCVRHYIFDFYFDLLLAYWK